MYVIRAFPHDGDMSTITSAPLPALFFAAFSTLAVAGCGVSLSLDGDTTSRIETEAVDADGVAELVISTENGPIEVVGAADGQIGIRATLEEHDHEAASFSVESEDGRLTIEGGCDDDAWERCMVGFEIEIPSGIAVDIETDNGPVTVERLDRAVTVETDNGPIDASRLSGDAVRARTDNGRIDLEFVAAPTSVDTDTDNGAIVVRVPDGVYDVEAASDNGPVEVDVDTSSTAERTIRAVTDNGSVRVERT